MATHLSPYRLDEKSGWAIGDPPCVRRRVQVCLIVFCVVFGALLGRLWYLQVVQGQALLAQAQSNRLRDVPLSAPRGLILDRRGVVLATSRASHSVAIVPAALPSERHEPAERKKILGTLAFLIGSSPAELERKLSEAHARGGRDYDPVRVNEAIDPKTITLVEENKWRLGPAVLVTNDIARSYPNGALAAHVLGYSGVVTADDISSANHEAEKRPGARRLHYDDTIGKSGVERQYDEILAGVRGSDQYEVDARGRPTRRRGTIKEKPGNTVRLTIDARLQRAAEEALNAARNSGAVAAIDPRNGEVLVLASRPTFNPNVFSLPRREFQKWWQRYNPKNAPRNFKNPLFNRAVMSRFPPASTYKMVTAAAGLHQGTLRPEIVHRCAGGMRLGRFFGCWKTHGTVNLLGALAHSCDVYFYETALAMGNPESSGPDYLAAISRQFGMGQPTGIDLPSDARGLVPDPAWRRRVNTGNPDLAHWYPGNTLNMSIGQGDVLATPLQMAMVTAAVANGGTLWQPHLLKDARRVTDNKIIKEGSSKSRSVGISDTHLSVVRAGMRQVVTGGTGKTVALPHVAVAGKTGSAEDANNPLPHAWFVCFAPFDKPRIAIAVIVENSGHGSSNAAPVAKKILEAAFPEPKSPVPTQIAARPR